MEMFFLFVGFVLSKFLFGLWVVFILELLFVWDEVYIFRFLGFELIRFLGGCCGDCRGILVFFVVVLVFFDLKFFFLVYGLFSVFFSFLVNVGDV